MGRRKDNDMEKLQEMLEGFLEAMDSGKGLPGFIDPLDLADGEDVQVIDNVHIKVDGDLTGMDMLDNYDRFEISDIAADMLYPEVLPEKPRVQDKGFYPYQAGEISADASCIGDRCHGGNAAGFAAFI